MRELLKTNDIVLISLLESLLKEADIHYMVLDQNMSVIEGSLGILPRRILVATEAFEAADTMLSRLQQDLADQ